MLTKIVEDNIVATVINVDMVCGRGRSEGSTKLSSQKSTQRHPSPFRYVNTEGAGSLTNAGRKVKCGECNEEGHNIRTCPVRR